MNHRGSLFSTLVMCKNDATFVFILIFNVHVSVLFVSLFHINVILLWFQ